MGTVRFPLDQDLPLALIEKMVRFKATLNLQKAEANKKRKR